MTFELEPDDIKLILMALAAMNKQCTKSATICRSPDFDDIELANMFEAKRVECERLYILLEPAR